MHRWSTRDGHKDFAKFSTLFREGSPRYTLDDKNHAMELPGTEKVNLKNLWSILKSKDSKLLNNTIFDGKFRLLDGERIENQKVAFDTYPRTGNSFLRRYIE